MDDIGHVLQAKFAHSYEAESSNGSKRTIRISPGDKYILLKKTNDDWWDVIPYDEVCRKPFSCIVNKTRTLASSISTFQAHL